MADHRNRGGRARATLIFASLGASANAERQSEEMERKAKEDDAND